MQSEIINEIIEVEDKALSTVDNARAEASLILNKADIEAKKIVKESVKQCKLKNQKEFEKIQMENEKEIIVFQDSLKDDYSSSNLDYKKIAEQLANKICHSSVFEV